VMKASAAHCNAVLLFLCSCLRSRIRPIITELTTVFLHQTLQYEVWQIMRLYGYSEAALHCILFWTHVVSFKAHFLQIYVTYSFANWVDPLILQCDSLRRFFIAEKRKESHGTRSAEWARCVPGPRSIFPPESAWRKELCEWAMSWCRIRLSGNISGLTWRTHCLRYTKRSRQRLLIDRMTSWNKFSVHYPSAVKETTALSWGGGGRGDFHCTICWFVSGT
jgi:hypothetical protein